MRRDGARHLIEPWLERLAREACASNQSIGLATVFGAFVRAHDEFFSEASGGSVPKAEMLSGVLLAPSLPDETNAVEVNGDRRALPAEGHHEARFDAREVELLQANAVALPLARQADVFGSGFARIGVRLLLAERVR